jgi:hypothetical protein
MSEFVGDSAHIADDIVTFSCVKALKGANGHGHFSLSKAKGFAEIVACRGVARIVSDTLSVQVIGPPASDKATAVYVAVIPEVSTYPTDIEEILSIGGSAYVEHSLYSGSRPVSLKFAAEAAHQIKPTPLIGSPPTVVFYFDIIGGDSSSNAFLKISGQVNVRGTGFVKTW